MYTLVFYLVFIVCSFCHHNRNISGILVHIKIRHVSLAIKHGSSVLNKKKSVAYLMGRAPENMLIVLSEHSSFSHYRFHLFPGIFVTMTTTTILYE